MLRDLWVSVAVLIFNLIVSIELNAKTIEIYSHRGAAGLSPENTISSYRTALAIGVHVVDMDIGMTQDDIIVVSHDSILNPNLTQTALGQWIAEKELPLRQMSFARLQSYRVGTTHPLSEERKAHPWQYAMPFEIIPSLNQVIAFIKQYPESNIRFQIEIKTAPDLSAKTVQPDIIVPALIKLVRENNIANRVEVHSFDWKNLILLQQLAPDITTSYLSDAKEWLVSNSDLKWTAGYDVKQFGDSYPKLIKHLGGKIWCPHYQDLTWEDLKMARSLGLKVNPWTVDNPSDMITMIEWEVDGIITNRPDILRGLLAARGYSVPPGIIL